VNFFIEGIRNPELDLDYAWQGYDERNNVGLLACLTPESATNWRAFLQGNNWYGWTGKERSRKMMHFWIREPFLEVCTPAILLDNIGKKNPRLDPTMVDIVEVIELQPWKGFGAARQVVVRMDREYYNVLAEDPRREAISAMGLVEFLEGRPKRKDEGPGKGKGSARQRAERQDGQKRRDEKAWGNAKAQERMQQQRAKQQQQQPSREGTPPLLPSLQAAAPQVPASPGVAQRSPAPGSPGAGGAEGQGPVMSPARTPTGATDRRGSRSPGTPGTPGAGEGQGGGDDADMVALAAIQGPKRRRDGTGMSPASAEKPEGGPWTKVEYAGKRRARPESE
jgi:hypothetical protein